MSEKKKLDIKELIKNSIPIIIFVAIMGVVTIIFWPYIEGLATDEGRAQFKEWIDGIGFWGWLATLAIQLLQIFVAFIPGEPVELILGYVWGPWLGTFTCLLGIFIGTATIYFVVRKLGMRFVKKMVGTDDLTKYKFLSDKNKVELTVFILFFIPGTPKDALTYIAPVAPIHPVKYLLIATFARIPSIITSTILGDSVAEGDYVMAVIVFIITALISILGIIFGNKYIEKRQKKKDEKVAQIEETSVEK
ncbi:MAG: TVP38/TMEM64 family protein [Clostridia bacterium]|nr:TVP38/TMEM64 family protein [Clostridia bacterium]